MNQSQVHEILPGMFVVKKFHKDWGIGQVQSSINNIITINFEHAGKKVINTNEIKLKIVELK